MHSFIIHGDWFANQQAWFWDLREPVSHFSNDLKWFHLSCCQNASAAKDGFLCVTENWLREKVLNRLRKNLTEMINSKTRYHKENCIRFTWTTIFWMECIKVANINDSVVSWIGITLTKARFKSQGHHFQLPIFFWSKPRIGGFLYFTLQLLSCQYSSSVFFKKSIIWLFPINLIINCYGSRDLTKMNHVSRLWLGLSVLCVNSSHTLHLAIGCGLIQHNSCLVGFAADCIGRSIIDWTSSQAAKTLTAAVFCWAKSTVWIFWKVKTH